MVEEGVLLAHWLAGPPTEDLIDQARKAQTLMERIRRTLIAFIAQRYVGSLDVSRTRIQHPIQ